MRKPQRERISDLVGRVSHVGVVTLCCFAGCLVFVGGASCFEWITERVGISHLTSHFFLLIFKLMSFWFFLNLNEDHISEWQIDAAAFAQRTNQLSRLRHQHSSFLGTWYADYLLSECFKSTRFESATIWAIRSWLNCCDILWVRVRTMSHSRWRSFMAQVEWLFWRCLPPGKPIKSLNFWSGRMGFFLNSNCYPRLMK